MRSTVLTRRDRAPILDISHRLDVLEQRGSYFRNPVVSFIATNGPAQLGVRVTFQVYLSKGIDSVEILRNTARDFASAAVLQTYAISTLALNKPIVYYDHDKSIVGKTAYYWIRAIPKPSKFTPIVQGPQIVAVPKNGDSTLLPPNDPTNTTNFATVDSIDAGSSATVRVYGTGGVGTSWTRRNGYGGPDPVFPAGTITGLAYTTTYYIAWNGSAYVAFTSFPNIMPDNYVWAGKVVTVASGGGGGTGGGGGSGGGGGGAKTS